MKTLTICLLSRESESEIAIATAKHEHEHAKWGLDWGTSHFTNVLIKRGRKSEKSVIIMELSGAGKGRPSEFPAEWETNPPLFQRFMAATPRPRPVPFDDMALFMSGREEDNNDGDRDGMKEGSAARRRSYKGALDMDIEFGAREDEGHVGRKSPRPRPINSSRCQPLYIEGIRLFGSAL